MDAEIFDRIPPFGFLTEEEKAWLSDRAQPFECDEGNTICSPSSANYDMLYLLVEGRVVARVDDEAGRPAESDINAPAYFGERSVFFEQPRSATIVADRPTKCISLSGRDIRRLVEQNRTFSQGFASALRSKHRIFQGYDRFVNLLFSQAYDGLVRTRDLIGAYKGLNSLLHRGGAHDEIDFDALTFALRRLPTNTTAISALFLTEQLPDMYSQVRETARSVTNEDRKREYYEILPGKVLILLRDGMTDTVDLITKFCIYAIEAEKIRDRMIEEPDIVEALSKLYSRGGAKQDEQALRGKLPFSPAELAGLDGLFGDELLKRLYEILVQYGDFSLNVKIADQQYSVAASELWLNEIRSALWNVVTPEDFDGELDVHIVSSNTHSVDNCLSAWLQQNSDAILEWAKENAPLCFRLSNRADQVYVAARSWIEAHPDQAIRRRDADREGGIYHLDETRYTGIEVSLIDANRLPADIDPSVTGGSLERRTLIVNIDYAYGRQAEAIIRNLIFLFGHRIRSISIFGKSGAIVGGRGDILLPDRLILQTTDELYAIPNHDLGADDFRTVGSGRPIHEGSLLTVLGTSMQNQEMLHYYRLFWDVIGMEMEGSFYLREILRARSGGILRDDVALRFAYYTSDTPLDPRATLASSMSIEEGIEPVYAVTRAVLHKILCPQDGA